MQERKTPETFKSMLIQALMHTSHVKRTDWIDGLNE